MINKWIAAVAAVIIAFCVYVPQTSATSQVSAKSAIVIEATSGRAIFCKNEKEKLPMASTTKIMTALLTLESGDLDEVFTVDKNAIMVEGSSMGLQRGDRVTKRSLAYGMLLPSGNDAANAGAVAVAGSIKEFVKLMNARAKMLGLSDTNFETPSGLDGEKHYSTAHDMARLARVAIANPDFLKICSAKTAKQNFGNPPYARYLTNHNRLLKEYDGAIGVKTGFTKRAGRCLVSAARRDEVTLIAVTLNASNDWQDHTNMLDDGFSRVKAKRFTPDISDIKINVVGSKINTMPVVAGGYPKAYLEDTDKARIVRRVLANVFYYAPVKSGDVVGTAEYTLDGIKIGEISLLAGEDATENITEIKLSVFERVTMFFKNIWYAIVGFFQKLRF